MRPTGLTGTEGLGSYGAPMPVPNVRVSKGSPRRRPQHKHMNSKKRIKPIPAANPPVTPTTIFFSSLVVVGVGVGVGVGGIEGGGTNGAGTGTGRGTGAGIGTGEGRGNGSGTGAGIGTGTGTGAGKGSGGAAQVT